jgi:hypothetical protein
MMQSYRIRHSQICLFAIIFFIGCFGFSIFSFFIMFMPNKSAQRKYDFGFEKRDIPFFIYGVPILSFFLAGWLTFTRWMDIHIRLSSEGIFTTNIFKFGLVDVTWNCIERIRILNLLLIQLVLIKKKNEERWLWFEYCSFSSKPLVEKIEEFFPLKQSAIR